MKLFPLLLFLAVSAFGQGFGSYSHDQPFFGQADPYNVYCAFPQDDIESYSDLSSLDTLNGGCGFTDAYVDRQGLTGIYASDDMESYTNGSQLELLNGGYGWRGSGWSSPYVDFYGFAGLYSSDDMESVTYTNGIAVNALNGGVGYKTSTNAVAIFGGPYVDR